MAIQRCPRCASDRVRRGYRPTSLLKKLTFRYNLLCDECNWEFVGFAIPGTVPSKSRKRKTPPSAQQTETANEPIESGNRNENFALQPEKSQENIRDKSAVRKKVKIKLP